MKERPALAALELWGGVECTVNRVGNRYFNQLERSGHLERLDDLDAFAQLGISTLRVPLLWELSQSVAGPPELSRWDPMLHKVRDLGLRAVAGLVHHGSGPPFTSLMDPSFEAGLEAFAGCVAERYPWLDAYTPVNEPLTTARFSGLYAHWYPHARGTRTFLRALVHECRATRRAMRAIRRITPHAKLVQTEDIGFVASSPGLREQAAYENLRRWLGLDLLCGRVQPGHPLYEHLLQEGIGAAELAELTHEPCVPDLIGINYYLTSDRFLDEARERHPRESWGGNGRQEYADVAAVMLPEIGVRGHLAVIREVWERYGIPIALTEVHLGCTREDQLRWLDEAHAAARNARELGMDVRAVTAWAMLGSFDWNSLVTRESGHYEPGLFDLRGPAPRPTALAAAARSLARGERHNHPVLHGRGWWRRSGQQQPPAATGCRFGDHRPTLIVGKCGTLGRAFTSACARRGLEPLALARAELDICDARAVQEAVRGHRPWAFINAAGFVRVDEAEHLAERCFRENVLGPSVLAEACRRAGIPLVSFSSDLVFDGSASRPYVESDATCPLGVYGRSKVEAERRVLDLYPATLLVRTSAFFGPMDQANFVSRLLQALATGQTFEAAEDLMVSPTYVPHLVDTCLDLLIDGAQGIWHLANVGSVSWWELASRAARMAGFDAHHITRVHARTKAGAARPAYSVLGSERGRLMPTLEEGLERYMAERVT